MINAKRFSSRASFNEQIMLEKERRVEKKNNQSIDAMHVAELT